jgi:ribosomal protein S17
MVRRLISLNVLEGVITSADPEGTITVAAEESSQTKLNVSSSTLTVRNGLAARPNKLQEGDVVYVVASGSDAKFVHSIGELTQEDLVARAASAVKGLLTEEEIAAIVRGDFDTVEQQLGPKVKERLIDQGLSEEEADALLSRNWDRIPELLQERAVSSVSEQLGVPPELIVDTVQQKWDSVRSFAEQKLTEYVIAALANTGALDKGSSAGA